MLRVDVERTANRPRSRLGSRRCAPTRGPDCCVRLRGRDPGPRAREAGSCSRQGVLVEVSQAEVVVSARLVRLEDDDALEDRLRGGDLTDLALEDREVHQSRGVLRVQLERMLQRLARTLRVLGIAASHAQVDVVRNGTPGRARPSAPSARGSRRVDPRVAALPLDRTADEGSGDRHRRRAAAGRSLVRPLRFPRDERRSRRSAPDSRAAGPAQRCSTERTGRRPQARSSGPRRPHLAVRASCNRPAAARRPRAAR